MTRRPLLFLPPVLFASLATAAPAAAEPVGTETARVTAVVELADGTLEFRTSASTSEHAGRALARRWGQTPDVLAASVDQQVRAAEAVSRDPLVGKQWGLARLQAVDVNARTDGLGAVVAVVDSGVDGRHPDLRAALLPGTDLVDTTPRSISVDPDGHGTHIAGIIAATAGNGIGGAGLAPGVKVLPVRVLDENGYGSDADVARGIVWAVDNGADVVNLSLGGTTTMPVVQVAIRYAAQHDVVVVAAAGNSGAGRSARYPAAFAQVIAVGAVREDGVRASFSSTGRHLDLVAPGVNVLSTAPGSAYQRQSGTSMAAAWVTASAALLRAAEPSLPATEVAARLEAAADDLGPTGPDAGYGAGLVDPLATLQAAPIPAAGTVPAPARLRAAPSRFLDSRVAVSRTAVVAGEPVAVTALITAGGVAVPGTPVALELRYLDGPDPGDWQRVRTGEVGATGRRSWTLRPTRSAELRVRAERALSSSLRVAVRP